MNFSDIMMLLVGIGPTFFILGIMLWVGHEIGLWSFRKEKPIQIHTHNVGTFWASDDDWAAFNFREFWSEKQ